MSFTQPIFILIFLPFIVLIAAYLKRKITNIFLLGVSLTFYAWSGGMTVLVLIFVGLMNYYLGILIGKLPKNKQVGILVTSLILNIGFLILVKYWKFLTGIQLFPDETIGILGISFFTFQSVAYMVDLYRGISEPEKNPLSFLLYFTFFPKIVSGPIISYQEMKNDIDKRNLTVRNILFGMLRFMTGLGKKLILADSLKLIVDYIFKLDANNLSLPVSWFGICCFALQLFYDFSGYTDMAVGIAQMLGFILPENFNFPYMATSVADFWTRWHMTLTKWFRNYLYIPMGGNRKGLIRTCLNLMIVFLVCGFWHGAQWTFIIWGLWHGTFQVIERAFSRNRKLHFPRIIRHFYAIIVILIGWVWFRAPNLDYAIGYLGSMFGRNGAGNGWNTSMITTFMQSNLLTILAAIIFIFPVQSYIGKILNMAPGLNTHGRQKLQMAMPVIYGVMGMGIFLYALSLIGVQQQSQSFIYAAF
jgi:alginate O-acetyltransferase complex protein AlgI